MTTLYKKIGRRYVAVTEHDPTVMDGLPYGEHLISVRPGSESRRHHIDPALAPMIAAGLYVEDAMSRAIYNAMELKPQSVKMTPRQLELMEELTKSMNRSDVRWVRNCASDAARAGIQALQTEAQRRMSHPAVRQAYDDFLLVAKLCEGQDVRNQR